MLYVRKLALLALLLCAVYGRAADVRDYGALGNDQEDDTAAFAAALQADRSVYVPPGTYRVGKLALPDETYLHGDGRASVIRCIYRELKEPGLELGSSCRITNLRFTSTAPFEGDWTTGKEGSQGTAILRARNKRNIDIDGITIENFWHNGIYVTDNCENIRITNSTFENMTQAMELDNCKRVQVIGNRIMNMRTHGIQFWGQSAFTRMLCEDLLFANNYVYRGGSGAIWGTGARRVVMIGNTIDGAHDIGLDLEWCYDCTVIGNTTRDCQNAGIALFLSCKNIAISGNSIYITENLEGRCDGIMLTGINRKLYRKDFGHRQISITGNTIYAEGKNKYGISIGSGYDIVCAANIMHNADLIDQTSRALVLDTVAQDAELRNNVTVVPLSQEWRFAIDPHELGVKQKWFDRNFDDSKWHTQRSDTGEGWQAQGFPGTDGTGYVGYAWYRAPLPPLPADQRRFAYVYFGMADEQAWVYLNGRQVGEHTEQSEGRDLHAIWDKPFYADVTGQLQNPGPKQLAVRVHNVARAGGLAAPVYLILSDEALTLPQQIKALSILVPRDDAAQSQPELEWEDVMSPSAVPLLVETFEDYDVGDDPAKVHWTYGNNGNNQWEGDTTYVVDSLVVGTPAYGGSRSLHLEQFNHNNEWDVSAEPVANFVRQNSGILKTAWAIYPQAGITLSLADSQDPASLWRLRIDSEGAVGYDDGNSAKSVGLDKITFNMKQWNTVTMMLDFGTQMMTITLNSDQQASVPASLEAVDQIGFRMSGYGSALLDSLAVGIER